MAIETPGQTPLPATKPTGGSKIQESHPSESNPPPTLDEPLLPQDQPAAGDVSCLGNVLNFLPRKSEKDGGVEAEQEQHSGNVPGNPDHRLNISDATHAGNPSPLPVIEDVSWVGKVLRVSRRKPGEAGEESSGGGGQTQPHPPTIISVLSRLLRKSRGPQPPPANLGRQLELTEVEHKQLRKLENGKQKLFGDELCLDGKGKDVVREFRENIQVVCNILMATGGGFFATKRLPIKAGVVIGIGLGACYVVSVGSAVLIAFQELGRVKDFIMSVDARVDNLVARSKIGNFINHYRALIISTTGLATSQALVYGFIAYAVFKTVDKAADVLMPTLFGIYLPS